MVQQCSIRNPGICHVANRSLQSYYPSVRHHPIELDYSPLSHWVPVLGWKHCRSRPSDWSWTTLLSPSPLHCGLEHPLSLLTLAFAGRVSSVTVIMVYYYYYYYKLCSQIEVPEHSNCRLVPYWREFFGVSAAVQSQNALRAKSDRWENFEYMFKLHYSLNYKT